MVRNRAFSGVYALEREIQDKEQLVDQLRDMLRTERAQYEELSRAVRDRDAVIDQQDEEIRALKAKIKELEW